jgi:CxxC motif-containing protein (DUF1111 family)
MAIPETSALFRCIPCVPLAAFATGVVLAAAGELHVPAPADNDLPSAEASAAYSLSTPGLDAAQLETFARGSREFRQRWVVLPSIGGKWGRGPTSNGETCIDCHEGNGRGRAPDSESETLASMIVRLSVAGEGRHGEPRPHPAYGNQLQDQGELGRVPAEGDASIRWSERAEHLADGAAVRLRSPKLEFSKLAFGPLGSGVLTSVRIAPSVFGAGLLDAVSESTLLHIARQQRALGYNGRPNYVWDAEKQATVVGRFGWKANQPSLRQQIASSYLNEMGVTTGLFKDENCPEIQIACRTRPAGRVPEQPDPAFGDLVFYARALGMPARHRSGDKANRDGERLFEAVQCAVCHVPEIKTGEYPAFPRLARRIIHPYTDLLLHDMGDGLADGRPDYRAGPRDWRTPPLWGIGLGAKADGNASLLHDGRARNVAEAILWHGGEATASRDAFARMPSPQREALLAFVKSL